MNYPKSKARLRIYRLWDANSPKARKDIPHRYYAILQNAHEAALREVFFGTRKGTTRAIELYRTDNGKLIQQYVIFLDGSVRRFDPRYAKAIDEIKSERPRIDVVRESPAQFPRHHEEKERGQSRGQSQRRTGHAGKHPRTSRTSDRASEGRAYARRAQAKP